MLIVFRVVFMYFSTMFHISEVESTGYFNDDPEESGDYCTLGDAMTKVYTLFFSTLEATDFVVPMPTLFLMFCFNVIVIILLSKIIIAVMSDCYADVNAKAELVFWDYRFEVSLR